MAPTAVSSTELENGHNLSAHLSEAPVPARKPRLAQNGFSNGTAGINTTPHDVIDVDSIRSHFPVLGGETIPFNNAAGTVVLNDAIERCELYPLD